MDQGIEKKDSASNGDGFVAIKETATMEFDPELEPLLRENSKRFVIFPIKYKDIWDMYKKVSRFSSYISAQKFVFKTLK